MIFNVNTQCLNKWTEPNKRVSTFRNRFSVTNPHAINGDYFEFLVKQFVGLLNKSNTIQCRFSKIEAKRLFVIPDVLCEQFKTNSTLKSLSL